MPFKAQNSSSGSKRPSRFATSDWGTDRDKNEIRNLPISEDDILVSYDVTALFTNVPLNGTINILVEKEFADDWFNQTYGLNLQKDQLTKLLKIATTNQLFQFNGQLYEQIDGVAMGSPLGPLMANVFLCHLEDKLTRDGVMPTLYKRYVDDTLARMSSTETAVDFFTTLNSHHHSLSFTMELPIDNKISYIGIEIIKNRTKNDTQVYKKPANTDLLLHFQSHTDKRYKDYLVKTMIHLAYALDLSSTTAAFNQECTRLRSVFTRLDYPLEMINSTITKTIQSFSYGTREKNKEDCSVVRVSLPLKDQTTANAVKRQMRDLSHKIDTTVQPAFISRKLEQDLKPREIKPPIVN
ncbi:uncharacterized protein LOC110048248 [Orbicella faveolata]|uniref:uncharacterized protein LOC110048248 n=1 Tax=Orbicella faveolata TaxID=48498 RepID=UPI0009E5DA4F|nr:uncharacterized protein LOC110048248 [Orbicella faveolata]